MLALIILGVAPIAITLILCIVGAYLHPRHPLQTLYTLAGAIWCLVVPVLIESSLREPYGIREGDAMAVVLVSMMTVPASFCFLLMSLLQFVVTIMQRTRKSRRMSSAPLEEGA